MRITLIVFFLCWLAFAAVAGPSTLEFESRTSSFSGRYSFEPRNKPSRHGKLEFLIEFVTLPEAATPTATFGDSSFKIAAVVLKIDGKPQTFPAELLNTLGFCTPDAILFYSDDGAGFLMTVDFTTGKESRRFLFRIRDEIVRLEPTK